MLVLLVLRRPFNMIDYDHFHWAFLRFQFQAELFLDGSEQRRAIGIYRRQRRHSGRRTPGRGTSRRRLELSLLGRVLHVISYFPVRLVLSSTVRPVKRESGSKNCSIDTFWPLR